MRDCRDNPSKYDDRANRALEKMLNNGTTTEEELNEIFEMLNVLVQSSNEELHKFKNLYTFKVKATRYSQIIKCFLEKLYVKDTNADGVQPQVDR